MSKPDILQIGAYPEWDIEALEKHFTLHRYFEAEDPKQFVADRADIIKGVATRGDLGLSREVMDMLPNLEVISVYGVGYDAVDIAEAKRRGIRVGNTPDVLTEDVADFAIAMMMAASRGIIGAEQFVRSGEWVKQGMYPLMSRVHGKKVGVLGLGRIGYEVAKRCGAFGMDIAYNSRSEKADAAEQGWTFMSDVKALAEHSDFLFVTLAATAETRHIINQEIMEAVGSTGMIINVSRAANIDEDAIIEALSSKKLGYAALDVFEGEPALNPKFLELDNIMLQPHQGSGTIETRKAMGKLVCDNMVAYFDGKDLIAPVV